jgi:glutathione S-transferase
MAMGDVNEERDRKQGSIVMLKIWGRKNSVNVQKAMWGIGELGLAHERIDIAGDFGGNREPPYLALNPNGLVPTLQDGDFVLWEANSILRYLAGIHGRGSLEPADPKARAHASQWMDWQLSVLGPAIRDAFWGLIRTPPEQRDQKAIDASKTATTAAIRILDGQLARSPYVAGDAFSIGDIPVGAVSYRFRELVPERPAFPHFERWYALISARAAFRDHILSMPLT